MDGNLVLGEEELMGRKLSVLKLVLSRRGLLCRWRRNVVVDVIVVGAVEAVAVGLAGCGSFGEDDSGWMSVLQDISQMGVDVW